MQLLSRSGQHLFILCNLFNLLHNKSIWRVKIAELNGKGKLSLVI